MINILFFASFREALDTTSIEFKLDKPQSLGRLIEQLSSQGPAWHKTFSQANLMMAVNQQMANLDTLVKDGDEVAFFPPVTGG